jgi:hypothetical protein
MRSSMLRWFALGFGIGVGFLATMLAILILMGA